MFFLPSSYASSRPLRDSPAHSSSSFSLTLVSSHLELTANQRSLPVNPAKHTVSIQCRTPAIIQPFHCPSTPFIGVNVMSRHAGFGHKHHLHTTTACLTICAGHLGIRLGFIVVSHAIYRVHRLAAIVTFRTERDIPSTYFSVTY